MTSKKSASALAAAVAAARTQANDLGDRIGPAAVEARDRIVPMVEDARDRIVPLVTEASESARETLAPVVEDARGRLADLGDSLATLLDEKVPGRTPVVQKRSKTRWLTRLLVLAGLGGLAAAVAQKLRGGKSSTPTWQSTAPSTPPPANDAAAGTPDEAVADATEVAHEPTTPDAPAEVIDVSE
jgi:hypothetical protein